MFGLRMSLASPLQGRQERGLSVLHYNPAMSLKNIVTNQKVTKEKLQRAHELRREMTPVETILWNELRANKLGVHFRRQSDPCISTSPNDCADAMAVRRIRRSRN